MGQSENGTARTQKVSKFSRELEALAETATDLAARVGWLIDVGCPTGEVRRALGVDEDTIFGVALWLDVRLQDEPAADVRDLVDAPLGEHPPYDLKMVVAVALDREVMEAVERVAERFDVTKYEVMNCGWDLN